MGFRATLNFTLPKKVTFVLDNADDIVESDSQVQFVNMLREMRCLSNQNFTFAITSRKTVNTEVMNIRSACLSPYGGSNLLLSKVHDAETRQKLSQTEKIVNYVAVSPWRSALLVHCFRTAKKTD